MLNVNNAPERARWEVLWVKDRKVQRKPCGTDLMEAIRIYNLVLAAGRPGATLRCCNMGFPPPESLQRRKVRGRHPVTKRIVEGVVNPMREKNTQGIFWCPYCMKLRRFVKRKSFEVEGITVKDKWFGCPMCGTSHRDAIAQRWNPNLIRIAYEIEMEGTRSPNKTVATRRAARRRKRRREST